MAPQQKPLMPNVYDTPQLAAFLCSLHATESLRFYILVPLHRFLKLSPRQNDLLLPVKMKGDVSLLSSRFLVQF
jgi:hypothetical protein